MEVSASAAKQFKVIRTLLAEADEVVIATDADREGEVIGREILEFAAIAAKCRASGPAAWMQPR